MESLPGFVTIPRLAGTSRPAGAFFFATVVAPAGEGQWKLALDGRVLTVSSSMDLVPGQALKLKLVSQTGGRWLFQLVAPRTTTGGTDPVPVRDPGALAAAFLSRGLPAAEERLQAWSWWLSHQGAGPSDRDSWAASLEARGEGPYGALTEAVEPWMNWQTALESGTPLPPPQEEACWDQWNLRRTPDGAPWLVLPLRWEYEGQTDAGLLQAHWNPQGQHIDKWILTASPAATPFRLEAAVHPGRLDLVWRFFTPGQRRQWESTLQGPGFPDLSTPELRVNLTVAGIDRDVPPVFSGGIDVKA